MVLTVPLDTPVRRTTSGVGHARENEEANFLAFRFTDAAPMRRAAGFG